MDTQDWLNQMVELVPCWCACGAKGWLPWDGAYFKCPAHYRQQPHPETSTAEQRARFPYRSIQLALEREAYVRVRGDTIDNLMAQGASRDNAILEFNHRVKDLMRHVGNPTPNEWLEAAIRFSEQIPFAPKVS